MVCPKCSKELPEHVSVCIFCGHNFTNIKQPASDKLSPQKVLVVNTSGSGSAAIVTESIKGWSWAGYFWSFFILPWVWGLFILFQTNLIFSIFLSIICFIISLILGTYGRELAWRYRHWTSLTKFNLVQSSLVVLWFFYLLASIIIVSTFNNNLTVKKMDSLTAKDIYAEQLINQLSLEINNFYQKKNLFPWDESSPIPDYFTTDIAKEDWLATLVSENNLRNSIVSEIKLIPRLILYNTGNSFKICYQPNTKVKKIKARDFCLQKNPLKIEAINLCEFNGEYLCLP